MSPKDPFRFGEDEQDRTVIGPRPGAEDAQDRTIIGRPPAGAPPTQGRTAGFEAKAFALEDLRPVGTNPLMAAAAPLIALVNVLRSAAQMGDLARLRQTVVEELRRFQQVARGRGGADEEVRHGHYALCALIDEVVLSTPWGVKSAWAAQTLVATYHNEVVSGDRLLEIAEALEARPSRAPNLLELVYLCISFGFEGRLRLEHQGASKVFQMRERLYNAIRQVRGPFERGLSPAWRGIDAAYRPIAADLPAWVLWSGYAVLALALYATLLFSLSGIGDRALHPLSALYQATPSTLNRTAAPLPSDNRLFTTILDILKPDIDAGRVAVTDSPDAVLVRLKDKGLFASGSAQLDDAYDETIKRVTQAIALTLGPVEVAGHTDNKRIRSLQFASNQELSEARAASVIAKLVARGADKGRLKPSGLGETQPVADNATDDGRRQNRRVEVTIPKTYAAQGAP